ncbi:MAG: PEP-CTERM sorting domain-containing protein [Steroidobacteraceae bacterium]
MNVSFGISAGPILQRFATPKILAAGALLTVLAAAPYASATAIGINFGSGTVGWGNATLTLATDPNSSSSYQPIYIAGDSLPTLSPYDPAGAQSITGASGSFNGVAITGVMALDQGQAPPGEILPNSFSWIYTTAAPNSYDNLFYVDGSPLVCPPTVAGGGVGYPFSGGFLDIYGVMFTLANGDSVGLWSDGVTPPGFVGPEWPGGLTYGLDVFTPTATAGVYSLSSDNAFDGVSASVPEPSPLWLFGAGVLALFTWRRSVETRKRSSLTG